jgi:hypothetical protein
MFGHGSSDAEIDETNRAFFVDEHIPGSDIAMNDARSSMCVVEGAAYLDAQLGSFFG